MFVTVRALLYGIGEMYSIQQRIFIYDSYIRTESARAVRRLFQEKFPGVRVPGHTAIHNLFNKFHETGSVQDKKKGKTTCSVDGKNSG